MIHKVLSRSEETLAYLVRSMRVEDIPQVEAIDREAFPTQWPPASYKHELGNKLAHYLVFCDDRQPAPVANKEVPGTYRSDYALPPLIRDIVLKARGLWRKAAPSPEPTQFVVGFVGLWYLFDEAHITSIAVRESHRCQGIGELLLVSAVELSQQLGSQVVTLEVRLSNLAAQRLYQKYGFKEAGLRHHYYTDNGEDALIMTTDNILTASHQSKFQELKQAHAQKWAYLRSVSKAFTPNS